MPLQSTSGAASYDAFGGGVAVLPKYIEDYFSAFLYTGNGSTQTINNGIDLSTKGGLVWGKNRDGNWSHYLADTARGTGKFLESNTTSANTLDSTSLTAFNANGFSIGNAGAFINNNGVNYVSWSWAKAPKFFDIVTYSGNSTAGREIAHNLGSTPGCIIVKRLNADDKWPVYHRGISDSFLRLNATDANAAANAKFYWGNNTTFIAPTSTVFTVATDSSINQTGGTYVAYLFAHDAGGFGLTGTDNVISCGSFTTGAGGAASVTLGYEPQWVIAKTASEAGGWHMFDNMRGMPVGSADAVLFANTSAAEVDSSRISPTATGFDVTWPNGTADVIYIAIRRGPMKVPTSGTSVFYPTTYTGTGSARTFSGFGFPPDMELSFSRGGIAAGDGNGPEIYDKLRGTRVRLLTPVTDAEYTTTESVTMLQDGISVGATTHSYINASGYTKGLYGFKRAPSFFDEVCYTGNATTRTINHNLGVVPEFMIIKGRTGSPTYNWICYHNSFASNQVVELNTTTGVQNNGGAYNIATLSSTVFGLKTGSDTNGNGNLQVAYLFATCAGVSKVGSYTGNGTTQTIDCGFTGGARFVLIKRTDASGDWYTYDTARGMTVLTDPYLLLNTTAAETATLGSVTTVSTGFALNSTILAAINISGGTYIFLAIA